MNLEDLNLSVHTFNMLCRQGIKSKVDLTAVLDDPVKREALRNYLGERGYQEVMQEMPVEDDLSDWDDTDLPDLSEAEIMSADYTKAVRLNHHIKAHAQIAQESLYEVCKGLKEMRDNKLYKELNYQNFEEYCEKEVGITYRQAKKYVAIASGFSADAGSQLPSIGTEKLYLLAKLDEPQREEIQQKVDIDSVSVKEMQKQIKELTKKNQEKQAEFDEFREGAKRRQDTLLTKLKEKAAQNQELENQITELENRPRDTVFEKDPAILEENEKLKTENQELKTKLSEQPAVQEMLPCDGESFSERRAEFNAYLKTLSDAMNHICAFIAKYQENHRISEVEKTIEKYINAMKG